MYPLRVSPPQHSAMEVEENEESSHPLTMFSSMIEPIAVTLLAGAHPIVANRHRSLTISIARRSVSRSNLLAWAN